MVYFSKGKFLEHNNKQINTNIIVPLLLFYQINSSENNKELPSINKILNNNLDKKRKDYLNLIQKINELEGQLRKEKEQNSAIMNNYNISYQQLQKEILENQSLKRKLDSQNIDNQNKISLILKMKIFISLLFVISQISFLKLKIYYMENTLN